MSLRLALLWSVVACVTAAPTEKGLPTVIPILSQFEDLEANGTYKFSYETGNGITREETSYNKIIPQEEGRAASGESRDSVESNEIHVQIGSYSYVAPDGTVISLRYTADENGFRPVGDHLPTPPPFVRHQINYANEKSGRSLKFDKSKVSESSSPSVAASIVTEKKSDILVEAEAVKESNVLQEKKSESEEINAQPQEVKTNVELEKKPEVKAVFAQPEEVKETNILEQKKSVNEALVAQPLEAKEAVAVPEKKPVIEAIAAQSEKEKETTTVPEKKPEIAAIDLAISVNPVKESNVENSKNEVPSVKLSLTVPSSPAKSEDKKASDASTTLEPSPKDAPAPQVTEVKVASEKKTAVVESPYAAPEKPTLEVAPTPAVVVELEKSPEKPATVNSTQSNSKVEEKSNVGESV